MSPMSRAAQPLINGLAPNLAFITFAEAESFKVIFSPVELALNLQIFFDSCREDFVPRATRQVGGFNSVQLGHV
jgi:hypothetical protein